MADEKNTQFNYLLNAFERASQADRPVDHGYRQKREALIAHVRELERKATAYDAAEPHPTEFTRRVGELLAKVPQPPDSITYESGWKLLNELQDIAVDMQQAAAHGVDLPDGAQR